MALFGASNAFPPPSQLFADPKVPQTGCPGLSGRPFLCFPMTLGDAPRAALRHFLPNAARDR